MQSARKVTLIPPKESQFGGSLGESEDSGSITLPVEKSIDKIKSKIYDKIHRFIKIILKLARSVGYDDDLRIKLRNGKYLEKTNIVDLLTHAMSAGKVLYGENEFIELLAESNVDPDLIINDNVRIKLIQFMNKNKKSTIYESENVSKPNNSATPQAKKLKYIRKGNKRFVIENDELIPEDEHVQSSFNKVIEVNRDGPTVEIDPTKDFPTTTGKRKLVESFDSEDSIDDEMIDQTRWTI